MEHSGVVGEGFQIVAFPAAIEIERFLNPYLPCQTSRAFFSLKSCEYTNQPYTATGKLNADKTPRTPRGFGTFVFFTRVSFEVNRKKRKLAFEYGMAWPLRADHPPIHHPRKANCIITLPNRRSKKVNNNTNNKSTHNVDEFLNLTYPLRTYLTHLE
jgi:hypothetical protein